MSRLRRVLMQSVVLALAGCGGGVEGTYTDGTTTYEFDDGQVTMTVSVMGQKLENRGTYTVDGKRITIQFTDPIRVSGNVTLTDDGDLMAPAGLLTKE